MIVRFDDLPHLIVNGLTTAIFLAALIWFLSPVARSVRAGWKSRVSWILAIGASLYVAGFYIPLGPLCVLWKAKRVEEERRVSRASANPPTALDVS